MMERAIEKLLFASRWIMAPVYLGLSLALVALGIKFFLELYHLLATVFTAPATQVAFSNKKGSIPIRTDVDVKSLDLCAQQGVTIMKAHCFTVDHRAAGRAAADALLAHGHRRIAVITGPAIAGDNKQRLQGLFDRLGEAGIAADAVMVEEGDFSAPSGWAACERLVARKPRITALFCANDQMAMGAISFLGHHGIRVPQQWSVMGYDDSDVAAFLSPRLTSVRIPIAEMALNACRMLINTRFGTDLPVSRKFVPTVVMRDSLAKAP